MEQGVERSPARTLLVSSPFAEHKQFYGRSMVEIGNQMGCSAEEAVVRLLAAGDTPWAAFGTMNEDNLERILAKPYVILGSDGSIRSYDDNSTHPRAFGTAPRFFRIASKNCDPASVIRRMTALPAAKFNLESRGIIAPGYFADLVLLDLDKFDSKADYSAPNKRSEGVSQVYVNGKLAFAQDPDVKTFRPGRMLRIK
jgi:N-acyl-D-amino-acid deacylase